MDYEFYDAPYQNIPAQEEDYFEQFALLCALELYEQQEKQNLIMPCNDLTQTFNLYFAEDPQDGVYRWQLHYPYAN